MLDASPNDMQSHNVLNRLGGNICYTVVVVYSNASVRKAQQPWLIFWSDSDIFTSLVDHYGTKNIVFLSTI